MADWDEKIVEITHREHSNTMMRMKRERENQGDPSMLFPTYAPPEPAQDKQRPSHELNRQKSALF